MTIEGEINPHSHDLAPKRKIRALLLGAAEPMWATARYLHLGRYCAIVSVITRKSSLDSGRTEQDFLRLAKEFNASFLLSESLGEREIEFAKHSNADVCITADWSGLPENFLSLFPYGGLTTAFGESEESGGKSLDVWSIIRKAPSITLRIKHLPAPGKPRLLLREAASVLNLDNGSNISDIRKFVEAKLPNLFCSALELLGEEDMALVAGSRREAAASKLFLPLMRRDGLIDWTDSAADIDAKIRAFAKPSTGAYTYMRNPQGKLVALYIWRSKVVPEKQAIAGAPGQLVACNKDDGEALVLTGDGLISLQSVSENSDGESFGPGRVWSPGRTRLGLSLEDEFYALVRGLEART